MPPKGWKKSDHAKDTGGLDLSGVDTVEEAPAEDKPPKGRPPKGKPTKDEAEMIRNLTNLYGSVGLFVSVFNATDGALIMGKASDRATELTLLARHHPNVWNMLKTLTVGGDYAPFIIGHGALAGAILQNHGINVLGVLKAPQKPQPSDDGATDAEAVASAYYQSQVEQR